ncbi:MAG: DUF4339 domain-containing protein [Planctomycetota bacterium]
MGILFLCQHCNKRLNVKSYQAGEEGFCPKCGGDIKVPPESTVAPELKKSRKNEIDDDQGTIAGNTNTFRSATTRGDFLASSEQVTEMAEKTTLDPGDSINIAVQPEEWKEDALSKNETFLLAKPENTSIERDAQDVLRTGRDKVWYVRHPRDGETGPVKGKEVERMLADGRIVAGCRIWREDWNDWEPAEKVFNNLSQSAEGAKDNRIFSDAKRPLPRSAMKRVEAVKKQRRQIFLTVLVAAGSLATVAGLSYLLYKIVK